MSHQGRRIRSRALALLIGLLALMTLAMGGASALTRPDEPFPGARVNAALTSGSRENTSVIVQNNSGEPATIAMTFYTPAGAPISLAAESAADVPAWGARIFEQDLNRGLLPGFRGVGVLSSDQPLNALLLREIWSPDDLRSYSIHNAHAGSGGYVVLPFVANQLHEGENAGALNTRFSIANAGLRVACVTITYEPVAGRGATPADGGSAIVSRDVPSDDCPNGGWTVAVAGQLTLAPEAGNFAFAMPAGTVNTLMNVRIQSTQPVSVAADIYRAGAGDAQFASYNGFIVEAEGASGDDVSEKVILPLAQKNGDGYWTEYAISNPWSEPVSGSVTYRGEADGRRVEVTVAVTAPARGSVTHSVFDSEELPEGFTGWALVEAERPLAALLLRSGTAIRGGGHSYSAAQGVPRERTTTSAKFPLIFRNAHGDGEAQGLNSWVSVAALDGGTATIQLITVGSPTVREGGCDETAFYQTSVTFTGSILFDQGSAQKTRTGMGATPKCLAGGMAIMSDTPIAAIGGVTSDLHEGDNDGLYNAFP